MSGPTSRGFVAQPSRDLNDWARRVVDWMDRMAADAREQSADNRFPALAESCLREARNYEAMADDGRRFLPAKLERVPGRARTP